MVRVRVMVRARVTLRVEVMVTVGFRISGTVKTRTTGLTMHTIVNDNQFSHTSRFWVEKARRKRQNKKPFLISAIEVLAQVHTI